MREALSRRLVWLTIALAAASGLATLSRWHWVADLFVNLQIHYAAFAALFSVGLVATRKFRWMWLSIGLVVWNGAGLVPYLWQPPIDRIADNQLHVVQVNVRQSNQTPHALVAWLVNNAASADVVVLFEVSPAWKPVLEPLRQQYAQHAAAYRSDNFGIAIFSRRAADRVEIIDIADSRVPSALLNGAAPDGGTLTLLATHPPPPLNGLLARLRNQQLQVVAELIGASNADARILIGDLNVTPWSFWFERVLTVARLHDAQHGHGYLPTWAPPVLPWIIGLPIDHTLVSDQVVVTRRDTGPALGSDHRPIMTSIGMRTS